MLDEQLHTTCLNMFPPLWLDLQLNMNFQGLTQGNGKSQLQTSGQGHFKGQFRVESFCFPQ